MQKLVLVTAHLSNIVLLGTLIGLPDTITDGSVVSGVGPIFLDKLRCEPRHTNLLDCPAGVVHGLATCTHAQDVGVRCPGTS